MPEQAPTLLWRNMSVKTPSALSLSAYITIGQRKRHCQSIRQKDCESRNVLSSCGTRSLVLCPAWTAHTHTHARARAHTHAHAYAHTQTPIIRSTVICAAHLHGDVRVHENSQEHIHQEEKRDGHIQKVEQVSLKAVQVAEFKRHVKGTYTKQAVKSASKQRNARAVVPEEQHNTCNDLSIDGAR